MNRAVLVCTLCALLSSSWLQKVDAQLRSDHDSGSIIQSIETLSKVVEGLQAEIKMQSSMLNNLEAKAAMHDNSLSILQATVDELKTLMVNSNGNTDEQVAHIKNIEDQSNMHTILLNKLGANLEKQAHLLHSFLTKEERETKNLTNMGAGVTSVHDGVGTLTESQNSSASKGIVQGIIAGTKEGVVIIALDSQEQRTISNKSTDGLAFNWQNQKIYWIESEVGIATADLDGSHAELLVSDGCKIRGLAVDQITGNIYYGLQGSNASIRFCDSMGQKCVTVVSGVDTVGRSIWDIALSPSEGLLFWSSPYGSSITQADMDGSNATVIVLEEYIYGLFLDDFTQKLYWANDNSKTIQRYNAIGENQIVQLNTTIYPTDIAVDGDTVYLSSFRPIGVYSVTSSGKIDSISNTTGSVNHIALYGSDKVFSRPNPCSNSPCANLCVLTRLSYTCL